MRLTKDEANDILHEAIWLARDDNREHRGTIEAYAREIINAKHYLDGLVPTGQTIEEYLAPRDPSEAMRLAKSQEDIVQ